MIDIANLSVAYGNHIALKNISLSINDGEMVGLLGPNGSGKTTLLLTLSGVIAPASGQISVNGEPLSTLSARDTAQQIASVPQRTGEPPDISAESLVLMGRYPYISFLGGYTKEDRAIAQRALQATRAEQFATRSAATLSGGEFQRVLIARALAQQTDCLLLDEATSGLDIARKVEIYDLLHKHHRKGKTVISAIHDLNMAALYCDRLVFLKKGEIVLDGPVNKVFTQEHLSNIYETRISVFPHPDNGLPQSCLVPERS